MDDEKGEAQKILDEIKKDKEPKKARSLTLSWKKVAGTLAVILIISIAFNLRGFSGVTGAASLSGDEISENVKGFLAANCNYSIHGFK